MKNILVSGLIGTGSGSLAIYLGYNLYDWQTWAILFGAWVVYGLIIQKG